MTCECAREAGGAAAGRPEDAAAGLLVVRDPEGRPWAWVPSWGSGEASQWMLVHTIVSGNTLWILSGRYYGTPSLQGVRRIHAIPRNRAIQGPSPDSGLIPGDRILIPDLQPPPAVVASTPGAAPPPDPPPAGMTEAEQLAALAAAQREWEASWRLHELSGVQRAYFDACVRAAGGWIHASEQQVRHCRDTVMAATPAPTQPPPLDERPTASPDPGPSEAEQLQRLYQAQLVWLQRWGVADMSESQRAVFSRCVEDAGGWLEAADYAVQECYRAATRQEPPPAPPDTTVRIDVQERPRRRLWPIAAVLGGMGLLGAVAYTATGRR